MDAAHQIAPASAASIPTTTAIVSSQFMGDSKKSDTLSAVNVSPLMLQYGKTVSQVKTKPNATLSPNTQE